MVFNCGYHLVVLASHRPLSIAPDEEFMRDFNHSDFNLNSLIPLSWSAGRAIMTIKELFWSVRQKILIAKLLNCDRITKIAIVVNVVLALLYVVSSYYLWSVVNGPSWSYYGAVASWFLFVLRQLTLSQYSKDLI